MPLFDISLPIHNRMHVWPTDPEIRLIERHHPSVDRSHTIQVTTIHCGSHTGTHLDTPIHMLGSDAPTLDDIPLDRLLGPARVFDLGGIRSIGRGDLETLEWTGVERVLFRTDNSFHWKDPCFYEDFVYLEPEAAEFLARQEIQLVGIDYLSIDGYRSTDHRSHFVLLERSIVILEGLNLEEVPPGDYELLALPMRLSQADGAPVRAVLRQ